MTIGIVVIGRNERAHLADCLAALPKDMPVVYADSGSHDDSVAIARAAGADIVALSAPPMLTAARGRNAGLARLLAIAPDIDTVQMVDGDCYLDSDWVRTAHATLLSDPNMAAVCGQLRERHPEASLYNRLCNREWQVPPGRIGACGGIAMFRVAAILEAGGYPEDVVAGEEPDLCLRMRARGWHIEAISAPMGTHDAGLTRFAPWWQRARRAGHAYAEHVARHGMNADPGWRRQRLSILVWGGALPLAALVLAVLQPVLVVLPVALWMFQVWRIAHREPVDGLAIGTMTMVAKFAQVMGLVDFALRRFCRPSY